MTQARIFLKVRIDASSSKGAPLDLETFKSAARDGVTAALQQAEATMFSHDDIGEVTLLVDYVEVDDSDPR